MPETVSPATPTTGPITPDRSIQITPELVKKIAARVYALMLADSRIERERRRLYTRNLQYSDGGRDGA